jgi:hypothetical protein
LPIRSRAVGVSCGGGNEGASIATSFRANAYDAPKPVELALALPVGIELRAAVGPEASGSFEVPIDVPEVLERPPLMPLGDGVWLRLKRISSTIGFVCALERSSSNSACNIVIMDPEPLVNTSTNLANEIINNRPQARALQA